MTSYLGNFSLWLSLFFSISQFILTRRKKTNLINIIVSGLLISSALSFGIGLYAFPEFVAHIPDFGIKLKLLLTTGLIPAGLLAFILNATLPKK